MNEWKWPGAKWWKFDFHTHTPASKDFRNQNITPEDWLKKFMQQKIDCVAITDHNSGEWIDKLKQALEELEKNRPDFYHPLYLFPGVEISANGGVHILAIFDPNKTTSDIDSLLGAVGYPSTEKGNTNAETNKSLPEVIDLVTQHNAIPIPAHVNRDKGLFRLDALTLKQVLNNPHIHAMELCDNNYQKPKLYNEEKVEWTEICGSDTHFKENNRLGHFTWVKMDEPSFKGLKLALIDGKPSVNRSMESHPNQHSKYIIEKMTIENTQYIGRKNALNVKFSPFLNTVIGGRGSGKSTLLELIRLVLRRDKEIPGPLKEDSKKYFSKGDNHLLLDTTELSLIYCKDDHRYRLNWSFEANSPSLEVQKEGDKWEPEEGEIKTLFPVYIYSQKQIFTLAQEPDALLEVIDKDPNVKYEELKGKHINFTNSYKQIHQRKNELNEKIAEENKLKGSFNDVTRQIEQIEKSGHKDILQTYRLRQKQLSVIKDLEESWKNKILELENLNKSISSYDKDIFDGHRDILQAIDNTNRQWMEFNKKLTLLDQEAKKILNTWEKEKKTSQWMGSLQNDVDQYKKIQNQLEQQNIDPDKYPNLLMLQRHYQQELDKIKEYTKLVEKYHQESQDVLEELQQNREQLTENRVSFLQSILKDNLSVQIEMKPFEQKWDEVEKTLRKILHCEDGFDRDFQFLKDEYCNEPKKIKAIKVLKNKLKDIYEKPQEESKSMVQDHRFSQRIKGLPSESINNLMCWFPEDGLNITFGTDQRNIQQGSPGQKTAALLAFILSYGDEPLLLDQPEDDLDNTLVYKLIVKQLRSIKSKRQVIIITHNANIVVNGDAEMVFPLTVKNGQSIIDHSASIQASQIRKEICNVLEGGQEAFKQRYKRIHLEQN